MRSRHTPPSEVIVIGAGLSGLAVAQALKQRRIAVRIVERSGNVAEAWRHRHPQLRLNTHRSLSGLPGMKLPRAAGSFPDRDSFIRYLEDYAAWLDVPIDFGVRVSRIRRAGHEWVLETSAGPYAAAHVVVATGHEHVPWMPDWPGLAGFGGEVLHAARFGPRERYRGKDVLVIGAGNSGTDVLNHLSRVETGRIWVSVRHGPVVFPTWFYGIPVQRLSPLFEVLPLAAVDRLLDLTERLAFGKLARWGLGKHPVGGATRLVEGGTAPAIDNGFIAALKAGKVEVVAEVAAFEQDRVRLVDGRSLDPEIVIAATGYRTGLEPILGHLGVLDARGVPTVHGAEQAPGCPGLWFTGMRPRLTGIPRQAGRTAHEIAAAIAASPGRLTAAEDRPMQQSSPAGKAA